MGRPRPNASRRTERPAATEAQAHT